MSNKPLQCTNALSHSNNAISFTMTKSTSQWTDPFPDSISVLAPTALKHTTNLLRHNDSVGSLKIEKYPTSVLVLGIILKYFKYMNLNVQHICEIYIYRTLENSSSPHPESFMSYRYQGMTSVFHFIICHTLFWLFWGEMSLRHIS